MAVSRFEFHLDPLPTPSSSKRVFSDPNRKRGKRLRRNLFAFTGIFFVWIAVFFLSVETAGTTPTQTYGSLQTSFPERHMLASSAASDMPETAFKGGATCDADSNHAFAAMASTAGAQRVFAHVPVSLEWSYLSVKRSCGVIDVLVPDWITIAEERQGLRVDVANDDTRMPLEEQVPLAATPMEVMPRIQLETLPVGSNVASKFEDDTMRVSLAPSLMTALREVGADGACLDVSQFPDGTSASMVPFVTGFQSMLAKDGLRSCVILGSDDDSWLQSKAVSAFDHVIVKAFYEPWVGSAPRPLSEDTWFSGNVERALEHIEPANLVVAIGNFSAKWETGVPMPVRLPFGEAMAALSESGAELAYSSEVSGSYAAFRSDEGRRQNLWMLDAASLHNQLLQLEDLGVASVGIWSLGYEDPGVWALLAAENRVQTFNHPNLTSVLVEDYVRYTGAGAALRVAERPQLGFRTFDISPETGRVTGQEYTRYPRPYTMERYGQTKPNELVLTFDDGPHAEYTTRILDTLKETETPAAFFVLGQSVMAEPDVLKRIYDEGHEIGAHSFSHPRMDRISDARTALEHDLTDRIIASAIGHSAMLYREPFLRSGGPISGDRIPALETVQANGSVIYGMDVVPKDWMGLSSDEIATYVIEEVLAGNGNVILLHDGGENREASVEALPVIIRELRALGYEFTTVSQALGIPTSDLMPQAGGALPVFDKMSFAIASGTFNGIVVAFWVVLVIGVVRSAMILMLAMLRRRHSSAPNGDKPKVAVVIPAFEEEAAIGNCIESVLASDYENFEIVVVNDGSLDNTLNEIFEFKHKKNVRFIIQPNQGKWAALNRALLSLDADIAVCIDADTQIQPDAVSKLAEHFSDPKIGAVAGKIAVGNRVNLLTRMQALEYLTAQNFDRRAFDAINGILVVPGALGAWRVSALRQIGYFCNDTLTEDSDLTIAMNRAGYRVVYDERAVAITEAPQTVRGLLAQRLRWSLGMFQAAWKHKRAIREGRGIGLISIPDMFIFGYLFPLLAPVADIFVIVLAYNYFQGAWDGDVGTAPQRVSPNLLWAFLALPVAEFLIAAFAVVTDKTAKLSMLLVWPFQRIFYRPLLYFTVFRALFRAISGSLAAWGRSKRQGHDFLLLEKSV